MDQSPTGAEVTGSHAESPPVRVLVVEDDSFSRTAVVEALKSEGFATAAAGSVADALVTMEEFDPHAVCTDLHLGGGPSGIALLTRVAKVRPWVGLVILTSHMSVELATGQAAKPPPGTITLVKSTLDSLNRIGDAVRDSISAAEHSPKQTPTGDLEHVPVTVSQAQAEILTLIAAGYTNTAIARQRNVSVRSVEMIVMRTFRALGIDNNPDLNPRVLATKIWQSGVVVVK